MPYLYPPTPATISGDVETVNRFMNSPTFIARRLRTILEQRYIADALLTERISVQGGAVVYETSEPIGSGENPRSVAPAAEYPLVSPQTGPASVAKTVKWGQDSEVTDEAIARRGMNPVNRVLLKMANQNVAYIDAVALSAIASAVTNSTAAAAAWATATAAQIFADVALADAAIRALNLGYDPDTVVVDDARWARAKIAFVAGGFLSREAQDQNPALTGVFPIIDGKRWLVSPNIATPNTALVLDSKLLGGMADENLGGPGYVSAGPLGIEAKSMRSTTDDRDVWRLRMRRVTVPIILEPAAGRVITGV